MKEIFNTTYEFADWLDNSDSNGADDIEFAEVFAILDYKRRLNGRRFPLMYDPYQIILDMDVKGLCKHLEGVLEEIQGIVMERMEKEKE